MFGVNPDRSVRGAWAGYVEYESTATTWEPAPTAYRSSVAVGDSETIRAGCRWMVTLPTRSGYDVEACDWDGAPRPPPPQAATSAATRAATREAGSRRRILPLAIGNLRIVSGGRWLAGSACSPPFLRGPLARRRAGGLARPRVGHHSCGTAPGSHRLRWTAPAGPHARLAGV